MLLRPPSPSKKDFSCQVNLFVEEKNSKSSVTVSIQIGEEKLVEDVKVTVSTVSENTVEELNDPKQLQDFIQCQFRGTTCPSEEQDKLKECNTCGEDKEVQDTIDKVESFLVKTTTV